MVRTLWNVSCLFYLFKEQINVQIPQYNYSEFCSCFYWISECCSSELFLRMLPLAHFETLLAFLVCELKFVVGNLEESSRGYYMEGEGLREEELGSESTRWIYNGVSEGPVQTKHGL